MKRHLADRNRNRLCLEILEERHLLTVVVEQLMTPDSTSDSNPRVMGSNIVWQGKGGADAGTDYEIFWYDGSTINQVTEDAIHDQYPQISALGIAWEQGIGTAKKIGFDDNVNPQQFLGTPLPNFVEIFTLSDTRLTWEDAAEADFEILTWNNTGGLPVNLSNNTFTDRYADSQGDNVVWVEDNSTTLMRNVRYFNGTSTSTIGTSTFAIYDPDVDGDKVAWDGFQHGGTNNHEIFYYNGTTVEQLTDDEKNDFAPQVQGDNVVWWNLVAGVSTIQYYDGSTVQTISTTSRNQWPQIDGNYVVWQGKGETVGAVDDDEIFLWDGTQVIQLTDNDVTDMRPQISGNHIVWQQQSGGSSEIFHATILENSTVTGRHLFYDNSKWDGAGDTSGINSGDTAAIATDKTAYLPGDGTITPASMSSYSRGLNGLFVDLTGTHGTLSLADFGFKMSNQGSGAAGANNTPSTWSAAPAPTAFTVLSDNPVAGTDRVEFIWADNAIDNRYLEVRVFGDDAAGSSNTNTGLPATDIFYFGSKPGDTFVGTSATVFLTSGADEIGIQASPIVSAATITSVFDMDRNGAHTGADRIVARTYTITALTRIDISNPPPPPAGENADAEAGIAFALSDSATLNTSADSHQPSGAVDVRPMPADGDRARRTAYFEHLDGERGPAGKSTVEADSVELPDDVLDALLKDLLDG